MYSKDIADDNMCDSELAEKVKRILKSVTITNKKNRIPILLDSLTPLVRRIINDEYPYFEKYAEDMTYVSCCGIIKGLAEYEQDEGPLEYFATQIRNELNQFVNQNILKRASVY